MYVTKQILNQRLKKSMRSHTKQICTQMKASVHDQYYRVKRNRSMSNQRHQSSKLSRPKTAKTAQSIDRGFVQQQRKRRNSFVKKINYQFDELKQISTSFDKYFEIKKKNILEKPDPLSKKVALIKRKIRQKQIDQIQNSRKLKRIQNSRQADNQPNLYLGYPQQKVRKVVPVWKAKNQDIKMITRCIKGGYVQDADQFCDKINKSQILRLKKKFITFNTLYDSVKGLKNGGIQKITPENIDTSSFANLVYYMENQKNLKMTDKKIIQDKIKLLQ